MYNDINDDVFLRPRFEIHLKENSEVLLQRFKSKLMQTKYVFKTVDKHVIVDIPKEENHFWSPQLNIEFTDLAEKETNVKVLFGPKPQVWTMFMFCHFAVGITFLIALIMLYVNWTLKADLGLSFIFAIVMPVVWISFYIFGRIGRSFGRNQMEALHAFMIDTLK